MGRVSGAFVGETTESAGEYHCSDFDWDELRREVEAQRAQEPSEEAPVQPWQYDPRNWERFHARDNASARFYKERRYLLLAFPQLLAQGVPQHVLEIGCGCGSSLLPVLKANPAVRVTATDLSPTAVRLFREAAAKAGIAPDRYTAFPCDAASASAGSAQLAGLQADTVLLIFTLAALAPAEQAIMLQNAYQALRPGGLLLVRDHGLYDITHLRMPLERRVDTGLYRRGDGTLCYFYTIEDLAAKAGTAGFQTLECKYACTRLLNRRKQFEMRRVFVHGVFRKGGVQEDA